ncbi:T9SS type A sorting domain-containing protein [bacterium]|nr:T9SS type A sorting domain-containing protein [bacterium]
MKKIAAIIIAACAAVNLFAQNSRTETLMQTWNGSGWENTGKLTYSYPAADQKVITTHTYDGAGWIPAQRMTMTNDAQGNTTGMIIEMYMGGTWTQISSSTTTNTYQNGNLVQSETNANGLLSRDIYTYENGKLKRRTGSIHTGAAWMDTDRETNTYDGDVLAYVIMEEYNGMSWSNYMKTEFNYSSGRIDYTETYIWDTDWVQHQIMYNYYDGDGSVSHQHIQVWNSGSSMYEDGQMWYHTYSSTSVREDLALVPEQIELDNYPNPFNPETTIRFTLPEDASVTLSVFNARGRLVRTLERESPLRAGTHTVQWDGRDDAHTPLPTGIYIYRLSSKAFTRVGRCLLVK